MIRPLRQRLREIALKRRHREAQRKVAFIETMGLPDELKLAAVARVMRQFEETLDGFTRS